MFLLLPIIKKKDDKAISLNQHFSVCGLHQNFLGWGENAGWRPHHQPLESEILDMDLRCLYF